MRLLIIEDNQRLCQAVAESLRAQGFAVDTAASASEGLGVWHVGVPKPGRVARDNLYALYECIIDPATGHYMSEDYSFCRRWRNMGGEIWVDLKSKLTHEGPF